MAQNQTQFVKEVKILFLHISFLNKFVVDTYACKLQIFILPEISNLIIHMTSQLEIIGKFPFGV